MSLVRPVSLAALALLLLATACGDGHTGDPATTEFAPELGVDLSAMQKRESGLYVLDRTVGTGVEATVARIPAVRYTLWLSDGTKLDSNEGRQVFEFLLGSGQVIAGWEEGIVGMRVGGQRRLVVPSDLGYGDKGGGSVPGKAVLVFDVSLLGVR
jgi:FKBP-type peptidyl-prolyl cis-trans isomerase FkpA